MSKFQECPRCGERSFESLSTHSYCVNCNYNADEYGRDVMRANSDLIPDWAYEAIGKGRKSIKKAFAAIKDEASPAPILGMNLSLVK